MGIMLIFETIDRQNHFHKRIMAEIRELGFALVFQSLQIFIFFFHYYINTRINGWEVKFFVQI